MARRKGAAVDAVQSKEEAAQLLGRYAEISGQIDGINAERKVKVAVIDADADERIARREEELKAIFARLKPWWEVAGERIAPGRRSTELGSCAIGQRLSTPALKWGAEKVGSAIARLVKARLGQFVRVKMEIDKQALIAAIRATPAADAPPREKKMVATLQGRLARLGFTVAQKDEFFIEPIAPAQPHVVVQEAGDA